MGSTLSQSQRWVWLLDVVFGAIIALGIARYEKVFREVIALGFCELVLSVVVAASICSFVVYDIAVYHFLVKKYSFKPTKYGFARFYLDLLMAFLLYVLVMNSFQLNPDWIEILIPITIWHMAAILWHFLAAIDHRALEKILKSIISHFCFVIIYWLLALVALVVSDDADFLDEKQATDLVLFVVAVAIFVISFVRWGQVISEGYE